MFSRSCIGKKKCVIDNFKQNFIFPVNKNCFTDESVAFYQYTCQQSKDQLYLKRMQGLVIVCLNILIGLIFVTMLRYFRRKTKIEFKQWDMDTVTVSDFTAELPIKKEMFENFKEDFERRLQQGQIPDVDPENYSLMYQFELELSNSIENHITRRPKIDKELERANV